MKIVLIVILAALAGFSGAYLIFNHHGAQTQATGAQTQQLYTCGMHPEVISTEPGYCPICGMKLVPKKDSKVAGKGPIVVDPSVAQNMGLVTAEVTRRELIRKIRTSGKIQYSEPLVQSINVKIPGWVEKLYVNYEGQIVKKGQSLFAVYSPELVAAQREYLVALKNENSLNGSNTEYYSGSSDLLKAAVMRLENWDISPEQIENLSSNGELTKTMLIKSPFDGVVIAKNVNVGEHLDMGTEIYRLADISKVWAVGYAYEQDLPFIESGQQAEVTVPSLHNKMFAGNIVFVSPFLNEANQAEIRLEIANPNLDLKPDMYAEITINSALDGSRPAIPRKAVINSGAKQVVYLANGDGSYEPRVITTGAAADSDLIEVTSGLIEGEKIVVSGQFLLDSESRLNESLAMIHQHGSISGDSKNHEKRVMENHQHNDTMDLENKSGMEMERPANQEEKPELSGIYTCPMPEHYHVLQYGSGNCPECGMKLVPVEQTDGKEIYVCPMPEDSVVSNKPGKCPKCGMNLVKLSTDAAAMRMSDEDSMASSEHYHSEMADSSQDESVYSGIYTCPMSGHYDVLQYGSGKCPRCGMALVPVEKTGNKAVYYCPMTEDKVVANKPGICSKCGMTLKKLI